MGYWHKKSELGLVVVLVLIIVVLFLGWIINLGQRECISNKDCGSDSYCGSDFSCHTYPTIEKTVVSYNLIIPSIVIGIALVTVAFIFKRGNIKSEKAEEEHQEEAKENTHYQSQSNKIKLP